MRILRQLLAVPLAAVVMAAPSGAVAQGRLDHRELAADQQIIHALNRLTFGARPGDVQKVRAIGLDKWVDQQLHPERIDDSSFEGFLEHYSILRQDQSALLGDYAAAQRQRLMARRQVGDTAGVPSSVDSMARQQIALARRRLVGELVSERVARAVGSNRQLEEVMTDFWLNHFNVFVQKGPPEAYYLTDYEQNVIRPQALGKFRDLLESVAKSPAMLFYLDNARSMADSSRPRLGRQFNRLRSNQARITGLNENYGRELLELHTLGVDGGYTQQDVINVARALTGWTIRPPAAGGGFVFRPQAHDAGEKIVLGHKLQAGRGIEDGEEVLDILARHPATARFIATKLARRFISDNPPRAVIDRAAAVFLKTDGDIREVVRTIITSNEFYAQQAFRAKVKSPFEVVVSAMRAMNAEADSTPRTALAIAYLGEPLFGHQAPNGYPETGDEWMNTGAILNRINFGMAAAAGRIPGARPDKIPGLDSLASASRQKQVDVVVSLLLGGSVSPDTRAVLLSGENPFLANAKSADVASVPAAGSADTVPARGAMITAQTGRVPRGERPAARAMAGALGRPNAPPPQLTGIAQVVGLALGSPEFQRR